jgi:hypothetical protein
MLLGSIEARLKILLQMSVVLTWYVMLCHFVNTWHNNSTAVTTLPSHYYPRFTALTHRFLATTSTS